MKKTLLLKAKLTLTIIFISALQASFGQAVLNENFDYAVGSNLTSNNWAAHSGAGTQPVTVNSIGLTFPGFASSGIGYSALLDNTGEDVNKTFSPLSTGTVYCSFLVNVTTPSAGYFIHLAENPIGTTFRGKVFVDAGTGSTFNFGLAKGSNTATLTTGSPYSTGTTYLLVIKYNIFDGTLNDEAGLFIFSGTPPLVEPGTPTIIAADNTTQTDINPGSIALRQYSSTQNITVDGIRIASSWSDAITETTPPVATFNPVNGATNVLTNAKPTVTFDEPIRKTDGTELIDGDLAAMITFKKTDGSGLNVPFSATIDAAKRTITVTPASNLENSQLYYLEVGPVEDNLGNEATAKSITFTSIAAATPIITVTYPNGGEIMYSGDLKTITWTTANFDAGELVRIEVWAIDGETGLYEWIILDPGTANDGEYPVTVGPNAPYGTGYIIKLSGVTNLATDSSDGPFTVIATATNMATLRTYPANTIIRFDGEAVISFIRSNRNQKYLQDATGGLLIDDASGVLTTGLAQGCKITGLEGTLGYFNGVLQLVPKNATVTIVSTDNIITPTSMTLSSYLANHLLFQSMLIKLTNVWFTSADGSAMFAAATNYVLTDGSNNIEFRTFNATETDIDGYIIPVQHLDLIGIGGLNGTSVQVYSRTTVDLSVLTKVDNIREKGISMYPVPATSVLNVKNISSVNTIEILDITGKVVFRMDDVNLNEVRIPVSNLRKGMYFIKLTTPEGKVVKRFIKS